MQNVKDKKFLLLLRKHIREIRKSKHLSQVDVDVVMDNHGEQILRGELDVSICTLKKIADVLNISLSDLVEI